jgi:hypothetical protein
MFQFHPYRVIFFSLSACVSIGFGFFAVGSDAAIQLIKHGGYWLMLLSVLLLGLELSRGLVRRQRCGAAAPRPHWPAVVFLAVCSWVVLTLQPSGYKIVMDEPVLAATSLQMHLEREVLTVSRGYEIGGVFTSLGGYVDKRPYFYPFLMSLLHDFTGYRSLQGVVLNAVLTPVLLTLVFLLGRYFERKYGGYTAVLLLMGIPLFAMNANGAAFEILNLVMILGTALAAAYYLRGPSDGRLNVLILMAVLLAQTRYESALFVLPVVALIGLEWLRSRQIRLTRTAILAPLFLMPIPLQQLIFKDYGDLWQLDHNGLEHPFSITYIASNLSHARAYFFGVFSGQPSSLLLTLLFMAALLLFLGRIIFRGVRMNLKDSNVLVCVLFGGAMVANFVLLMAYHWGQIDDIVATRLVLPFLLFQVFGVVWATRWLAAYRYVAQSCLVLCVVYFITVARPLCARSDFLTWARPLSEVTWLRETVQEFRGESVLFVTDRHLAVLAEQVSALTLGDAISKKAQLDLHQRLKTFNRIFFVSLHPIGNPAAYNSEQAAALEIQANLDAAFSLRLLQRDKLDDQFEISFSELESVRLEPGERIVIQEDPTSGLRLSDYGLDQFSSTLP